MASQQQVPQHGEAQVVDYATQEKGATVAARTAPGSDSSDSHSMKEQHEWKPGWMTQFPYTGFGALLGVVICSAAAVGVVYASNGKAKSEWKLKAAPNVLLSIFNSLSGILVTMAVGQGIAISWWRRAMKGTTVENLHHSWSFSSSIAAIVKQYKFFNIIALVSLNQTLLVLSGERKANQVTDCSLHEICYHRRDTISKGFDDLHCLGPAKSESTMDHANNNLSGHRTIEWCR